jgi:hypothetical protein
LYCARALTGTVTRAADNKNEANLFMISPPDI